GMAVQDPLPHGILDLTRGMRRLLESAEPAANGNNGDFAQDVPQNPRKHEVPQPRITMLEKRAVSTGPDPWPRRLPNPGWKVYWPGFPHPDVPERMSARGAGIHPLPSEKIDCAWPRRPARIPWAGRPGRRVPGPFPA